MFAFILFIAVASATDFKTWAAKHNKHYTAAEALRRRAIFNANARFVAQFNKDHRFKLSVDGPFAAMTNAEYQKTLNAVGRTERKGTPMETLDISTIKAATELDLRDQGVVPPVRDQGSCGSCYTFGALASLEGRLLFEKGGNANTLDLSEQQLVDCSKSYGNNGCNGGLGTNVYDYIIDKGVALESKFPYTEAEGTCSYKTSQAYAKMTGYVSVTAKSSSAMKTALAGGIVDTSIDASSVKFQLYSSGVYEDSNCATGKLKLNHEVSAVGYGTVDGTECLYVRNSWGTSWGDAGYVYMPMASNTCGILSDPYYPTGVSYA